MSVQKIKPAMARDSQGKDVLPDLIAVDDRYLPMPTMEDSTDITFHAPPKQAGMERAVFLHTRGYYKLHLPENGDPDTKTLAAIENEHGAAARFAASRYGEWQVASSH